MLQIAYNSLELSANATLRQCLNTYLGKLNKNLTRRTDA